MKCQLTLEGEIIRLKSDYSPLLVERIRNLPGRQFHPENKTWTVPAVRDVLLMVCDIAGILPAMLGSEFASLNGGAAPPLAPVDMSLIEGHKFLTPPYQHQRVNLARLMEQPRWLLADDMGTGKSHAIANRLRSLVTYQDNNFRALILCPKSVMDGWQKQLKQHADLPSDIIDGGAAHRRRALDCPCPIKIVNYEMLRYMDFDEKPWGALVLDEVHRCKNLTVQTSKLVRRLSEQARFCWALSGTPAPNGLEDWCGVLAAVDPAGVPWQTKSGFEARYCLRSRVGEDGPWKISGYRNILDLQRVVSRYTSRVTKEVLTDLPAKTFMPRTARLIGEQARIYREIRNDAVARLGALKEDGLLTVANVLTELLRLLQIVGGFVPADDGRLYELPDKAKIHALMEVLEDVGDRQVVIWTAFDAEANWIARWLIEKHDCSISILTGQTTGKARCDAIERFRDGSSRYFVGTTAAGGVGINGLEVADVEVFYSRNYNLTDYLQAQDRLHRIGQKNNVTVVNLLAANTIDEKVDAALERKASLQELLLQRPEDMI